MTHVPRRTVTLLANVYSCALPRVRMMTVHASPGQAYMHPLMSGLTDNSMHGLASERTNKCYRKLIRPSEWKGPYNHRCSKTAVQVLTLSKLPKLLAGCRMAHLSSHNNKAIASNAFSTPSS
jgi:hypothetical protein